MQHHTTEQPENQASLSDHAEQFKTESESSPGNIRVENQSEEAHDNSKANRFTESIMTVASNLQSNYDKIDTESWEKKAKQDDDNWTLGGGSQIVVPMISSLQEVSP